ncbi:MAG: DUF1080 domain-containing protein, partial [Planctomycetes bacterium]|nr:DUF1080 domain-containing protein [Planctomycetota bacterium]
MIRLHRSLAFLAVCLAPFAAAAASEAETKHNVPPKGFAALFNGKDLSGWKAMPHFDPRKVEEMSDEERKEFFAKHWDDAKAHWSVEDGELVNDGHGAYLTTGKDYADFELVLQYKTVAGADSGIYLRGTPQVQIWDYT